jgi:sterol desaturase/sphingolipid hydroxylase (fatty acid hydroxylase superfamily)
MSARAFATNVTIILSVMAIGALLESIVPMFAAARAGDRRRRANLALTALSFGANWALASIAAVAALALRPAGLMAWLGVPLWAQIAAGIIVLDFSAGYLSHRALHMLPLMWRFHQIHHSDEFVDVTTTYRTHPVETVWRFMFAIVPVWLLGIPAQAVVIQRLLQATNGVLEHANVRLWPSVDRALSSFWVTPNVHKIHHSRDVSDTNSNYGNVLCLYDRLLGTFTPAERAASVIYGLDGTDPVRGGSFSGLLSMPFARRPASLVTASAVRMPAAELD